MFHELNHVSISCQFRLLVSVWSRVSNVNDAGPVLAWAAVDKNHFTIPPPLLNTSTCIFTNFSESSYIPDYPYFCSTALIVYDLVKSSINPIHVLLFTVLGAGILLYDLTQLIPSEPFFTDQRRLFTFKIPAHTEQALWCWWTDRTDRGQVSRLQHTGESLEQLPDTLQVNNKVNWREHLHFKNIVENPISGHRITRF